MSGLSVFAIIGLGVLLGIGVRIGMTILDVVYRLLFLALGKMYDVVTGNAWEGITKEGNDEQSA